jgi:hypothetical protein
MLFFAHKRSAPVRDSHARDLALVRDTAFPALSLRAREPGVHQATIYFSARWSQRPTQPGR